MEDTETSRLLGACDNYLKSKDYFRQNIPRNTEKCVNGCCVCFILFFILFCSIGLGGIALILYYSKDYFSLLPKLAGFFVILALVGVIFILKFDPSQPTASYNSTDELAANQLDAQNTSEELVAHQPGILRHRCFGLVRTFCCHRSCCPVSTEDRRNLTEEYSTYHPAALHNEAEDPRNQTEEHSAHHPAALHNEADNQTAAQHGTGEEEIVYQPAVLRHRFFRLGRIFCCPRRCYPTVSTEDLLSQTEESATCQLATQHDAIEEETVNQLDRIPVQTGAEVLQPSTLQASSELLKLLPSYR